ncbi:NAD-dependent dehydratase [Plantibacter sp. PA-3-X8]|uniref:NAD(P)H-binding protein n=1 Tax=Plantibacter sp. PA-3-X8 TaxID=2480625 RepID=UPI000F5F0C73|nr:NAD(P)H-binding protein [Plantibacter sp. PA-3-X8]AZH82171.1 NAD-dependent dehydratase [Plantibacter sp. PA-3-X8]
MTSRDTTAATENASHDYSAAPTTRVFIFGITGRVGRLLATRLRARGVVVSGLTRSSLPAPALANGVTTVTGELGVATTEEITAMISDWDVIVFAAGSNAGPQSVTDDIDDAALQRVSEAVTASPGKRLILLSVMPEAWRERQLSDDEEHYFAVKKRAEVALTRQPIDWVILRPSLLTDDPARGTVALGPAELHDEITRADVATVLEALILEPNISRQILELNTGPTAITEAVGRIAHAYQA